MVLLVVLIVTALALYYYIATKHYKFWTNAGIKCLTTPTLRGAIKGSFMGLPKEIYTFAPEEPYIGINTLSSPDMSVRDPEMIKQLITKDFDHFYDRGTKKFNEKWDPLSANLFSLEGKRWKNLRAKLTRAFSSAKLRGMFPLSKRVVDELVDVVTPYADTSDAVDLAPLVSRCTADVIMSVAFGVEGKSLRDPEDIYLKMLRKNFNVSAATHFRQNLFNAFPALVNIIPPDKDKRDTNGFFIRPFSETLTYRKRSGVRRNDFVDLLLETQRNSLEDGYKTKNADELTDNLMAAQAWGFFTVGSETTANTISFAIFELANNLHYQDRLKREVDATIEKHGALSYDALKDMTFLHQVVSETLRLYPSATTLKRTVRKTYTMPDARVTLPVGVRVFIHLTWLHRDPKYYPDPDVFNPERFSEEATRERHKYVYLPFGEGPRMCIGVRFALVQVKLTLASLLSQFEFRPKPGVPYPPVLSNKTLFTSLKHGAPVLVTRKSRSSYQ